MKTKISLLFTAALFIVSLTQAQYYNRPPERHVMIQGQVVIPGGGYVAVNYNQPGYAVYDNRGDYRRGERRDWRAEAYDQYCRETRQYRMNREDFYRNRCNDRYAPPCPAPYRSPYRY